MRLCLLPISTRRTLIYCEPLANTVPKGKQSWLDWTVNKSNTTWAAWEKNTDSIWGWKRKTTTYGNMMFRRIPFEEWGLKSIPPLRSARSKRREDGQGTPVSGSKPSPGERIDVAFPALYQGLCKESVMDLLKRLSTERQVLHRSRMTWSIIGMPLSAPFALLPVIPNIPFFYLVFRAYSHWKAWAGSKHLQHLLKTSHINPEPSPILDSLYTAGLLHPTRNASRDASDPPLEQARAVVKVLKEQTISGSPLDQNHETKVSAGTRDIRPGQTEPDREVDEEVMLLRGWNGKLIAERLRLPGLEVEIERAVEQVENSIGKPKEELAAEKKEIEALAKRAQATGSDGPMK